MVHTVGRDGVTEAIWSAFSPTIIELVELRFVLPLPKDMIDISVMKVLRDGETNIGTKRYTDARRVGRWRQRLPCHSKGFHPT